jgi:hypothetical protein
VRNWTIALKCVLVRVCVSVFARSLLSCDSEHLHPSYACAYLVRWKCSHFMSSLAAIKQFCMLCVHLYSCVWVSAVHKDNKTKTLLFKLLHVCTS